MKTEFNKKILLKYVPIHDANLSLASGVILSDAEISEGYEYCTFLEKEWNTVAQVLEYYTSLGFKLPNQTPVYLTHPRGTFTPFSDPLTIHIKKDLNDILATLIHEYCHVLFLYHENDTLADKIWNAVQKAFPTEDFGTQDHIIINKLTEAGLYYLWGKEKTDAILMKERNLPGLEQAWGILDSAELRNTNPVEAILELCAQQSGK